MKKPSKHGFNFAIVMAAMLLIGYLDYITGNEIRIFPLYFLPLAWTAKVFGRTGAIFASLLATIIWFIAQFLSGREYSHEYIWLINFITQGTAFLMVTLLMSSLRTALGRERELSRTDALTGLLNSRALHEIAGAELALCHRHKRPAVMAFIDLDNFKSVNDTFGHSRGDKLLCQVATVLVSSVRSADVVARIGGDEFAVFLPEMIRKKRIPYWKKYA
jgi:predicted signal transduction protein with EAL and GGDEF domain